MNRLEDIKEKLIRNISILTQENIIIAFSGGVDSSLLLKIACEQAYQYKTKVYALIIQTMLHPAKEVEEAKNLAKEFGAIPVVMAIDELQEAGIIYNPENRCYLCKKYMFQQIISYGKKQGIKIFVDGTNEDDLHVYRPGIRAKDELGVKSPLAQLHITKSMVRQLAVLWGLSVSEKPSTPCMATRFPYGTLLEKSRLQQVEDAEEYIRGLGFSNLRVRVYEKLARIEVDPQDFISLLARREEICNELKELGFDYITMDLEGFLSGSMDKNLKESITITEQHSREKEV